MNDFGSLHYNAIGPWLKERFGVRMVKLSLDAGLSCPNRDGSRGTGGCSFCLGGSGGFAAQASSPELIASAAKQQIELLSRKWPEAGYIAYFQSFTNTYAPADRLRALWDAALSQPGVKGLAIATRPDCLGPDILELLAEFRERTFLWVELGLQTSNEKTAAAFNRCYSNAEYEEAVKALSKLGIPYVTHLILGLPGESREDMLASAAYVSELSPFGIKLHMLHLMRGTAMGEQYLKEPFPLLSLAEYSSLAVDILERLPAEITIHRLTGDAPGEALIAPEWARNKHSVLNSIQQEFSRRGSFQGSLR